MLKPNVVILVGIWLMFLLLTIAVIASYDTNNRDSDSIQNNFYISILILLYSPSVVLLFIYLLKNHFLEKKIYLFIIIESIFLFFGIGMAPTAPFEPLLLIGFFSIPIPIFLFWMKVRKYDQASNLSDSNNEISNSIKKNSEQPSDLKNNTTKIYSEPPKNLDDYLQRSVSELLMLSESEFLEFKSTLKWDIRLEKANPELVGESIKTVAGFLNNKGGILVIGYDDDNNVLYGLEKDYPVTSKKSNYDGWQQYFINQINERLGKEINHYFSIESIPHNGKTLARINVSKSTRPVFAKQNQKGGDFFVRIHGQTENLNPEDTNKWISEHFSA